MDTKMNKKKAKSLQKSSRSKKKASDSGTDMLEGEAVDEELHSLTHYAGDEEKLVEQMFAAIQGTKLEAMMPAAIKAIPLQDLKLLCIHELRGISKKRIVAIIQGNPMSDSSGSSDDDSSSDEDDLLQLQQQNSSSKDGSHRGRSSRRGDVHSTKRDKSRDDASEKPLDIVELEMRARLIQTMLKNNPKHKGATHAHKLIKDDNIKSEPLSDRSPSYSSGRNRSGSRSYSNSRSASNSDSGEKSKRRKHGSSHRRSRRGKHHDRRKRGHGSSSKKRAGSRDGSVTEDDAEKKKQAKTNRISKKEFEYRMKKAKENRSYRKRKDSDEDDKRSREEEAAEQVSRGASKKKKIKRELGEVQEEGQESEREEGEIDSNEEEEGSYYSDASVQRKKKHRRRSGSHSSRSGRSRSGSSFSDQSSRSRSRSASKKTSRDKRRPRRDVRMPVDKRLIHETLNDDIYRGSQNKTKPGIETVDSEEDFDYINNGSMKNELGKNMVPRTDRSNVSFSFNKKPQTTLQQGTDLEFGMSFGRTGSYREQQPAKEQIVISSDSETERRNRRNKAVPSSPGGETGAVEHPMEIKDTNGTRVGGKRSSLNIADQSDLKLCEETVMMKDILADIDAENNTIEVKKERVIKTEPNESETLNVASRKKRKSIEVECDGDEYSIVADMQLTASNDRVNNSDINVKQELLSPRAEEETFTPPIPQQTVKSEPWDVESSPYREATERPYASDKTKKKSRKKKNRGAVHVSETDSYGIIDTPIASQPHEQETDGEEGACTDQDTDINESYENNGQLNSSIVSDEPKCNEDFEEAPGMENTCNSPSKEFNDTERHASFVSDGSPLEQELEQNNDEDEDSGLVDLPEDEHFEVDDDDEEVNVSKYDAGNVENFIDPNVEDGELTADKIDFYRGAEELAFGEDTSRDADSRAIISDGKTDPENYHLISENTNDQTETEDIEDGGLVELHPFEAEELSGVACSAVIKHGNTEIIGEIEPSSDDAAAHLAESGSSWSSRWLQSEKVQEVMSSSKMISRMRKKIKIEKLNAKSIAASTTTTKIAASSSASKSANAGETADAKAAAAASSVPVIGSMEEYQRVIANQETAATQDNVVLQDENSLGAVGGDKPCEPTTTAAAAGQNSSEDSADDELWSKMMGN